MARTTVGVLRGGPSQEYEVSLASGASLLSLLPEDRYHTRDIFIDRTGQWYVHGVPVSEGKALHGVDVVCNALHGAYGEDGTVQKTLDTFGVPYTGSGVFGSALAFDKVQTARTVAGLGTVRLPAHVMLRAGDVRESPLEAAQRVFSKFGPQYIIKPVRGGSSHGVTIASTINDLAQTLATVAGEYDPILVQQYISGREATCGVIEDFRNEKHYTLPPIEISYPKDKQIWDAEIKYDDTITVKSCPGNFSQHEKEEIQEASRAVHKALGLRHYSRSDFIIAPSGVYFLEVNNLPGLSSHSLFPIALDAVGVRHEDFLSHLISLAITHK